MYKVFFNEKVINIAPPGKITISKPVVDSRHFSSTEAVAAWFSLFIRSAETEVVLIESEPNRIIDLFKKSFHFVPAAGGVVRRRDRYLFIFKNGKWDLPKGKVEQRETAREAALREVQEECGIKELNIVRKLEPTYHFFRSPYPETKGAWIFKETEWYEMIYKGDFEGCPEKKENITLVQWFDSAGIKDVLENTYANLNPLIYRCFS